jgi:hypothetical protein
MASSKKQNGLYHCGNKTESKRVGWRDSHYPYTLMRFCIGSLKLRIDEP